MSGDARPLRPLRPLLSRVADSIYWMARYIERAENVARFIDVNLNLQIDLPLEPAYQWQPLIDTAGDTESFKERFGEATEVAETVLFLASKGASYITGEVINVNGGLYT